MPSPLLVTLISTSAWRSSTVTVTRPPSGVYRDAFCKRFASTWASSSGRLRAPIACGRRISTLMRRRPQLVGRVDDELAPHALLFLQARGHLVKGIGERDHLARSLSRDTCVIVAMSDTPGGSPDLFQRPRKMTCQYNGEPQAEDHPQ